MLVLAGRMGLLRASGFSSVNNQTCSRWQPVAPKHGRSEVDHEDWCQLHMSLTGSFEVQNLGALSIAICSKHRPMLCSMPSATVLISDCLSGQKGPHCPVLLDVRFSNGDISIGNRIEFGNSDRWSARLTSDYPSAYFLLRRQKRCSFAWPITQLLFRQLDRGQVEHLIQVQSRVTRLGRYGNRVRGKKITVITQLDANRLPRLELLAKSSTLPVMAAVYCDGTADTVQSVERYFAGSAILQERTAIELVGPGPNALHLPDGWLTNWYPIQALRNIALECAFSDWVLYVEVDMRFGGKHVEEALYSEVLALSKYPGQVASVLPVYELLDASMPPPQVLPERGAIHTAGLMPCSYGSHQFTNYSRWEEATPARTAELMNNGNAWFDSAPRESECVLFNHGLSPCSPDEIGEGWAIEPYFLLNRRKAPGYDPVVEFGMWDKLSQIKAMAMLDWRWALNAEVYLFNAPNSEHGLLKIQNMKSTPVYQQHAAELSRLSEKAMQAAEDKARSYMWLHMSSWLTLTNQNMTIFTKPPPSLWWKEWSPEVQL